MPLIDWRELYASNQAVINGGSAATMDPAGRHARLHVPVGVRPGAAVPLVCMLHGCTQDAQSFAAATCMDAAADRHGFAVVYPQQERRHNQNCCWNWFLPAHQVRDAGEPAEIASIIGELASGTHEVTVDPRRVFVAGMSAGAAMATVMAATYPDLFAAVAIHSGLPYRCASSVINAFGAMTGRGGDAPALDPPPRPMPALVIHGSEDGTVKPVNASRALEQWLSANRLAPGGSPDLDPRRPTSVVREQVKGGHPYVHSTWSGPDGAPLHELLVVEGMGHAWSGGAAGGSFTDPRGPDASEAIWRFFSAAA